jgi:septum formation protein
LLTQLGICAQVVVVHVDETRRPDEPVADLVCRLAQAKARAGLAATGTGGAPVLGADTVVALGEEAFGKPADAADARSMLARLSGRTHDVWTAVAVADASRERVVLCRSEVRFRPVSARESLAYWRTGEPADKAGGYAVQGLGAIFIADLKGSYSGVMGLPLFETARLLEDFGLELLPSPDPLP